MSRPLIAIPGTLLLFVGILVVGGVHVNHINITYGADHVNSSTIEDQSQAISVSELPPKTQKYATQTIRGDEIDVGGYELIVLKNKMLTVTSDSTGWHLGWPDWGLPFQEHPYFRTEDKAYYRTTADRDSLDDFSQTPVTITGIMTIVFGAVLIIWGTKTVHPIGQESRK